MADGALEFRTADELEVLLTQQAWARVTLFVGTEDTSTDLYACPLCGALVSFAEVEVEDMPQYRFKQRHIDFHVWVLRRIEYAETSPPTTGLLG
jgi:hypothetical protein